MLFFTVVAILLASGLIEGGVIVTDSNPCAKRWDGFYPSRNAFEYVECRNHHAITHFCDDHQVFEPESRLCVDADKVDSSNYCQQRENGDYNWPFNCHQYVSCSNNHFYKFDCSIPTLVFDPNTGKCMDPGKVQCQQVDDHHDHHKECLKRKDGRYAISDVYQYLECKHQVPSYHTCPSGRIFNAKSAACVKYNEIEAEKVFCENRLNGNYMNPWDCHKFITCSNGYHYSFNCSKSQLVYDPTSDRCKHAGDHVLCREIPREETVGDDCYEPRPEYCAQNMHLCKADGFIDFMKKMCPRHCGYCDNDEEETINDEADDESNIVGQQCLTHNRVCLDAAKTWGEKVKCWVEVGACLRGSFTQCNKECSPAFAHCRKDAGGDMAKNFNCFKLYFKCFYAECH